MTAPHKCPNCKGTGRIDSPLGAQLSKCQSCGGEGIVWEPKGGAQEGADRGYPGQLDLTYDGE